MKSSEILRKAAQLVEGFESTRDCYLFPSYGCYAIFAATPGQSLPWYMADEDTKAIAKPMQYFRLCKPNHLNGNTISGWFGDDSSSRIIALCLAAAIAESEGD